jgi:hypothetical protein
MSCSNSRTPGGRRTVGTIYYEAVYGTARAAIARTQQKDQLLRVSPVHACHASPCVSRPIVAPDARPQWSSDVHFLAGALGRSSNAWQELACRQRKPCIYVQQPGTSMVDHERRTVLPRTKLSHTAHFSPRSWAIPHSWITHSIAIRIA